MDIFGGFEGYRQPNETEIATALASSLVILDTNVLLNLYASPQPARDLALKYLESIGDRIWVPHQAMREFWRNRHDRILENKKPRDPLEPARQGLLGIINQLRPDNRQTDEIVEIKSKILALMSDLKSQLDEAAGDPLDVGGIIRDPESDPVVHGLSRILDGKIGSAFDVKEESTLVKEGLRRFSERIPPGYKDGPRKKDQRPECGTGDFLLWEQVLRHVDQLGLNQSFVIVTGDEKEDWRMRADQNSILLGARPELVSEALVRTGVSVIVISPPEFYRFMESATSDEVDADVADSLISSSEEFGPEAGDSGGETVWSFNAYKELLQRLEGAGYLAQAATIRDAAARGGFIERSRLIGIAGYEGRRSLRRFSLPATRLALGLAEEGLIDADSAPPLSARYDGPGQTIGYEVPDEFCDFESDGEDLSSRTWLEAAVEVASTQPDKEWSVAELVEGVRTMGLRDLSRARTPEATLARDLRMRQVDLFHIIPGGLYKLIVPRPE